MTRFALIDGVSASVYGGGSWRRDVLVVSDGVVVIHWRLTYETPLFPVHPFTTHQANVVKFSSRQPILHSSNDIITRPLSPLVFGRWYRGHGRTDRGNDSARWR